MHGELKGEARLIDIWSVWSITNQHFLFSSHCLSSLNSFCPFFSSFTSFNICSSPLALVAHLWLSSWNAFCSILVPIATFLPSFTPHHVLQRISFAAAAVNGLDLPLPPPPSPAPPFLSSPHSANSPCSYAASAAERWLLGSLWDYHDFSLPTY